MYRSAASGGATATPPPRTPPVLAFAGPIDGWGGGRLARDGGCAHAVRGQKTLGAEGRRCAWQWTLVFARIMQNGLAPFPTVAKVAD